MKTCAVTVFAAIASVVSVSGLAANPPLAARESAASFAAPAPLVGPPNYKIEIQPETEQGPRFRFTSFEAQPFTAIFFQFYAGPDHCRLMGEIWDAFLQGEPPVDRDIILSLSLPGVIGGQLPDRVEVAAAVLADGTTFGRPDLLKAMLDERKMNLKSYDWAVSLLQKGIQEGWTCERYLEEVDRADRFSSSIPGEMIAGTLNANKSRDNLFVNQIVGMMIKRFTPKRDALRESKPDLSSFDLPN
jgi:hypothetical protein